VARRKESRVSAVPVDLAQRRPTRPSRRLETFANPNPRRDYEIRFECPEFTCVCPMTGQPDFAVIRITYVPDRLCVELKSLKLYLWSYRDEGAFHEAVTNRILDDLLAAVRPRRAEVVGDFFVRGGIHTVVVARHPDNPDR
jgi:7-cyano-7-deazaguanine reductase